MFATKFNKRAGRDTAVVVITTINGRQYHVFKDNRGRIWVSSNSGKPGRRLRTVLITDIYDWTLQEKLHVLAR